VKDVDGIDFQHMKYLPTNQHVYVSFAVEDKQGRGQNCERAVGSRHARM